MTRAETLPVFLTSALALAAASGYVLDLAGFGVSPVPVLLLSITGSAAQVWFAGGAKQRSISLHGWACVHDRSLEGAMGEIAHYTPGPHLLAALTAGFVFLIARRVLLPRAAVGPWITAEGRSYAIADLRLLPDEVRSRVDIVRTFGTAAVIKRADVMMGDCDLGR